MNDFLAGKKYLIGDKPCNEDASVFGQVAQIIYTNNGILNKFIKGIRFKLIKNNKKNTFVIFIIL